MSSSAKLTYFVGCRRTDIRRLICSAAAGIQREQEHILDPRGFNTLKTGYLAICHKSSTVSATLTSAATTGMTSPAKLTYFPGRGRAEGIRLLLSAARIQWEEEHIVDPDQFDEFKKEGNALFQQIPVLQIDGLKMTQTFSIVRYLAKTHGFMGKTPEESAQIDILTEGARDMANLGFNVKVFTPKAKQDALIAGGLKKCHGVYFPAYEKVLKENGSNGYLVGDSLSMADLMFLEVLLWAYEYEPTLTHEYPNIKKFHDTLTNLPQLKAYLEGPQRFPQPDRSYFDSTCAALKISQQTITRILS